MKTANRDLVIEISKQHLQKMTTQVKECLAYGCNDLQQSNFSAIDLWNIQRRKKTILARRN